MAWSFEVNSIESPDKKIIDLNENVPLVDILGSASPNYLPGKMIIYLTARFPNLSSSVRYFIALTSRSRSTARRHSIIENFLLFTNLVLPLAVGSPEGV